GTVAVEIAKSKHRAWTVLQVQVGQTEPPPPAFLVAAIDEGLVAQLDIPALGLVAVGGVMDPALHLLAAGSRANNAHIQVQATGFAPALVLLVGEHRHAGEQ